MTTRPTSNTYFLATTFVGLLLVGCGAYSYLKSVSYEDNAVHAIAMVEDVDDAPVKAGGSDGASMHTKHACTYTLKFQTQRKDEFVTRQVKIIGWTHCLGKGEVAPILFDPQNPDDISISATDGPRVPYGKLWIVLGVAMLGVTYFLWTAKTGRKEF